jgi:hypothetical protein
VADLTPYINWTEAFCSQCESFRTKGISPECLEYLGWRKINEEWWCPICTGNTGNFKKHLMDGECFPDML